MPKVHKPEVTRLYLPSTDNKPEDEKFWVELKTEITLGDIMAAREGNDDVALIGLIMISRLIVQWNFLDDNDQLIPINIDTLQEYVLKSDYEFIDNWLNEHLPGQQEGLAKEEKKDSTATSIPVSTVTNPPSSLPATT